MAANIQRDNSTSNQRQQGHVHNLRARLRALCSQPANRICSECPERDPTWASLIRLPFDESEKKGGRILGCFTCFRCYSFHFQLGQAICRVKSVKVAEEWTEDEVRALEFGGNYVVNLIYEAKLSESCSDFFDKHRPREPDTDADSESRKKFVQNKYIHRRWFSKEIYQEQMELKAKYALVGLDATAFSQSFSSSKPKKSDTARRSRSFDDSTSAYQYVRKPMRRRSQSFQSEKEKQDSEGYSTNEDTDEDRQYLPSHLADEAGIRRRPGRRSSMPLLGGGLGLNSDNTAVAHMAAVQHKARRDSLQGSKRRRASVTAITNQAKKTVLGAPILKDSGRGHDDGSGDDYEMDLSLDDSRSQGSSRSHRSNGTVQRSNCRSSVSTTTGGAYKGSMDPLNCAPCKPTRNVSDDENETTNPSSKPSSSSMGYGDELSFPTVANRAARRMRRLSMPSSFSQTDYKQISTLAQSAHDSMALNPNFAPSFGCLQPRHNNHENDLETKLGYGAITFNDSDDENDVNSSVQYLKRPGTDGVCDYVTTNGGNAHFKSVPSHQELGYGEDTAPLPPVRKSKKNSVQTPDKREQRILRRCSTGGALDMQLLPRSTTASEYSFADELGYENDSSISSQKTGKPKKKRTMRRRSSTGGALVKTDTKKLPDYDFAKFMDSSANTSCENKLRDISSFDEHKQCSDESTLERKHEKEYFPSEEELERSSIPVNPNDGHEDLFSSSRDLDYKDTGLRKVEKRCCNGSVVYHQRLACPDSSPKYEHVLRTPGINNCQKSPISVRCEMDSFASCDNADRSSLAEKNATFSAGEKVDCEGASGSGAVMAGSTRLRSVRRISAAPQSLLSQEVVRQNSNWRLIDPGNSDSDWSLSSSVNTTNVMPDCDGLREEALLQVAASQANTATANMECSDPLDKMKSVPEEEKIADARKKALRKTRSSKNYWICKFASRLSKK